MPTSNTTLITPNAEPKIIQPEQLKLGKYKRYRPAQEECIGKLLQSEAKIQLVQAPTGSGKSLLAAAYHKHLSADTRMVYTCHSKTLQHQFVKDFPHAVLLQGRANYRCSLHPDKFPEITAADCVAGHFDQDEREACKATCPYEQQKRRCVRAPVAVLNTAKLLTDCQHVGSFSEFKFIVLDEADCLEEAIMGMVELRIPRYLIRQLRLQPPPFKTKQDSWHEWAANLDVRLSRLIKDVTQQVDEEAAAGSKSLLQVSKELKRLTDLQTRLHCFRTSAEEQVWVNCTDPDATEAGPWVFKPVLVSSFCDDYLWQHADKFLLMSATIVAPRIFAQSLGVSAGEWNFIEVASTFPAARRPIFYRPAADVTYKTKDTAYPKLAAAIDEIIAAHPGQNILVHTHSYDLTKYLFGRLKCDRNKLLSYYSSAERESVLDVFKANTGMVLLAPSLERGVDLPKDQCGVIIIAKVPYPSIGDKQVNTRLYSTPNGQLWFQVQTVRAIVQSTGRGMRSADDFCISYILDKQFAKIPKELLPGYWKEAIR